MNFVGQVKQRVFIKDYSVIGEKRVPAKIVEFCYNVGFLIKKNIKLKEEELRKMEFKCS
jgi:hypothetical protein